MKTLTAFALLVAVVAPSMSYASCGSVCAPTCAARVAPVCMQPVCQTCICCPVIKGFLNG